MDPMTAMALSAAIGSTINFFGSSNPADAAMEYSEQLPGVVTPYYQPYIDTGLRSMNTLEGQFNRMVNNPSLVQQMLGYGYEKSPGYNYQYDEAMRGINNAAASGGVVGTPMHQQQAGSMATDLANQDYWNYYNANSNIYNSGLQGHGDLNQLGYGASNSLASLLAQNLMNQASLAASSAKTDNSLLSGLTGGLF